MKTKGQIIVGISGASGAIYGIRMLEVLKSIGIETHLIISKAARITIAQETGYKINQVTDLADNYYNIDDIAAKISSGSFKTSGMIIIPCSMKTIAEIATGCTTNLISRAADVILKERKKLVLSVRETPFNLVHLRNMVSLTEMGAIIAPPLAAFYPKPQILDDLINHNIGRILDLFDIEANIVQRWGGIQKQKNSYQKTKKI